MGLFQHPHLTRGVVKTAKGAFVISRGLVDMPDELGESLGWRPADPANATTTNVSLSSSTESGMADHHRTSHHSSPLPKTSHAAREKQIAQRAPRRSRVQEA